MIDVVKLDIKRASWNKINANERSQYGNSLAYLLSNYLWITFLIPFFLYFIFISHYQEVPIINSFNQTEEWNSSLNPHIFGFISDLHITSKYPKTIENTDLVLQILNDTGVEKILVAGDLADNFLYKKSIKHGCPIEDDYIQYKKIESKYPHDLLIVASGNHDEFGVESYDSSDHFILKYCEFYKKNEKQYEKNDNFLISKVEYDSIEFYILNPYHYPTVPSGLGFFSDLTTEMLDKIELFLSSNSNFHSKIKILITHYPTAFTNSWVKSSSQKSLVDILADSKFTAILCGDTHHELIMHTKSSLEIHARSVKSSQNSGGGYRYISIDNGGLNDQPFILNNEMPVAVLTHPVKKKYVSDRTDFSIENFKRSEIRIVHFSENENLNVSVTCSSLSKNYINKNSVFLDFQRIIRKNQSLYSTKLSKVCKIDKENDEFRLVFDGDWKYVADFVVGNQVKLENEILPMNLNRRLSIISMGFVCFFVIFFIWCPFPSLNYFDMLSSWISYRSVPKLNNTINVFDKIIGIVFGFIVIKSRIYNNMPKWIQITFFVFVLSPFFLPISLMKIGQNSYGFICVFGYYLNGFYLDLWGAQLTSYFVLFVLLPSTIVFSAISYLKQTEKFHFVFIVDVFVAFLQFFLIKIAIGNALYQSTTLLFAITSPLFTFIPLAILTMELSQIFDFLRSNQNIENNFAFDSN